MVNNKDTTVIRFTQEMDRLYKIHGSDRKINFIKDIRNLWGIGLSASKNVVESYIEARARANGIDPYSFVKTVIPFEDSECWSLMEFYNQLAGEKFIYIDQTDLNKESQKDDDLSIGSILPRKKPKAFVVYRNKSGKLGVFEFDSWARAKDAVDLLHAVDPDTPAWVFDQ